MSWLLRTSSSARARLPIGNPTRERSDHPLTQRLRNTIARWAREDEQPKVAVARSDFFPRRGGDWRAPAAWPPEHRANQTVLTPTQRLQHDYRASPMQPRGAGHQKDQSS